MELTQIRMFVAVADELHFRRAAERLCVAQTALSRQIRRLEGELGVELFERSTRQVRITAAGHAFLTVARRILQEAEDAAWVARGARCGATETVSIGAPYPLSTSVLPTAVREWSRREPRGRVRVRGGRLDELVALVRRGVLDLALVDEPVDDITLTTTVLRRWPVGVLLGPSHRLRDRTVVRVDELVDEPFVGPSPASPPGPREHLVSTCASAGFAPRLVAEVDDAVLLTAIVAAGLGIAIVPESWHGAALPDGVTWVPLDGCPRTSILGVVRRSGAMGPSLAAFVAALEQLPLVEHRPAMRVLTDSTRVLAAAGG